MRMYDLIMKKRNGGSLSEAEIRFMIDGYVKGTIPDYQMAAMMMAVYFVGMNEEETLHLTMEMAKSGDMLDLSAIHGLKADKHSTGGVGDKTTLILAPALAALGAKVAKMSGRGLGHTGGTIDKLESIPGFRTEMSPEEFFQQVNQIGVCVIGQSGELAPADKKIYALRDATATVESIPLIASSIMSKKLAAGTQAIVLDVTCGSGAFMKTPEQAKELAQLMIDIGVDAGRHVAALVTNMDIPLGHAVGNMCEVREAMEVLQGRGPEDLLEVCVALGGAMWMQCCDKPLETCQQEFREVIANGKAWAKFNEMVQAQGGDLNGLGELTEQPSAVLYAWEDGYISSMRTEMIGKAAMVLGAGREKKEDCIDPLAGLIVHRKTGDMVKSGEAMVSLYTHRQDRIDTALNMLKEAMTIGPEKIEEPILVYDVLSGDRS